MKMSLASLRLCRFQGVRSILAMAVVVGLLGNAAPASAANIPLALPDSNGDRWVTIGSPGNAAYVGAGLGNNANGRGSVGYSYRIGQLEVNSGQWWDFYTAMQSTPDITQSMLFNAFPSRIGLFSGQPNWRDMPVGGFTWHSAAMYCNWLHNDKAPGLASFMAGAYDVSTFGRHPTAPFVYTDQMTRSRGAKYWIPSLDEWMKAAYFDPTKTDNAGWWMYPNQSDNQPVYGWPGASPTPWVPSNGETSAGGQPLNGLAEDALWYLPLGSYQTASYYGLRDVSGGAGEWIETAFTRTVDGQQLVSARYSIDSVTAWSYNESGGILGKRDIIGSYHWQETSPASGGFVSGFRLASSIQVPSPGPLCVLGVLSLHTLSRGKRKLPCFDSSSRSVSGPVMCDEA